MKATLDRTPQTIELPNVAERRQIHLINPAACGGKHTSLAKRLAEETGGEVVFSQYGGFAEDYAAELFTKDRFAHLVVYGGDGTICETVNGIMKSGNNHTASFSVIPMGSGNDFSAFANDGAGFKKAELQPLDVCRANDRYFINVMNIGFDCNVVTRTARLKKNPLLRGKMSYIAGLVEELIAKTTTPAKITIDNGEVLDTTVLLTLCANGKFYGGGFAAAPLADLQDGLMDVLVVKDVSRRTFLGLVSDYKKGTHIGEDGVIPKKFEDILMYRRCAQYRVSGIKRYCIDGEVLDAEDGTVSVKCEKSAVWFAAL